MIRSLLLAASIPVMSLPVTAQPVASPPSVVQPSGADFQTFFEAFRSAVIADDREAVASMVRFPFTDFRVGHYCEPGPSPNTCRAAPDSLTSDNKAGFLQRYDAIFTPAVVAAIRERRLRGFRPGIDDGQVGGPIGPGEYLIDLDDTDDQRVFTLHEDGYKLDRVPFYS